MHYDNLEQVMYGFAALIGFALVIYALVSVEDYLEERSTVHPEPRE